jgi:mono/diheme cytochrome c family protein
MRPFVLMIAALAAALPLRVTRAEEPTLPRPEEAIPVDGETMFATSCGFCHQNGGRVAGKGPKLAGTQRSDEFLADRIRKGKQGVMPAYGRVFSEAQIMTIVAYIRTLDE